MSKKQTYTRQGLQLELKRLWSQLQEASPFLRGSIGTIKMSCTRKDCPSCKTDTKHPATYLSAKVNKKTELVYLSKAHIHTAKQLVRRGQRAQKLFDKILGYNLELFRLEIRRRK